MPQTHALSDTAGALRPPPLHALHVFAVAVRAGSFTRAAAILGVTQGAVSRQVKQLEDDLGVTLFVRHKRGLRRTAEADLLFATVDDGLTRILDLCAALRTSRQVLTLRLPPTLAVRWFLPMLPSLREMMPGVDIRMSTDDGRGRSLEEDGVDAAILYGGGRWPDLTTVPLMAERLTPVCAPSLARRLRAPADLRDLPILQCPPFGAWDAWLAAAGEDWRLRSNPQSFDTLELALSAATRGQGVALGDLNMMREALRDGVLVAPFEQVLDQGMGYHIAYSALREIPPRTAAFAKAVQRVAQGGLLSNAVVDEA